MLVELAPELDAVAEAAAIDAGEEADHDGLVAVPGAPELLAGLPAAAWAVVTSAHRSLAVSRLTAVGLPVPGAMVCGDEVSRGKPDPEGYVRAAGLLGIDAADCLVLEDSRPGSPRAGPPVRSWWPSRRRSRSPRSAPPMRWWPTCTASARRSRGSAVRSLPPDRGTGICWCGCAGSSPSSPCSRSPRRPPWHPPRPRSSARSAAPRWARSRSLKWRLPSGEENEVVYIARKSARATTGEFSTENLEERRR